MAVVAPLLGAPLLGLVSHYPRGDWRIGAPFYFCAILQAGSLFMAVRHFRQHRRTLGVSEEPAFGAMTEQDAKK